MVVPLAAGLLSKRKLKLPFWLGMALCATDCMLVQCMIEPLTFADQAAGGRGPKKSFSLFSALNPLKA
eukprot:SAG31_NODE_29487_length_394_cov_1.118644_2_plen_67_part_01